MALPSAPLPTAPATPAVQANGFIAPVRVEPTEEEKERFRVAVAARGLPSIMVQQQLRDHAVREWSKKRVATFENYSQAGLVADSFQPVLTVRNLSAEENEALRTMYHTNRNTSFSLWTESYDDWTLRFYVYPRDGNMEITMSCQKGKTL